MALSTEVPRELRKSDPLLDHWCRQLGAAMPALFMGPSGPRCTQARQASAVFTAAASLGRPAARPSSPGVPSKQKRRSGLLTFGLRARWLVPVCVVDPTAFQRASYIRDLQSYPTPTTRGDLLGGLGRGRRAQLRVALGTVKPR
jgi:hypothetical protein